MNNAPVFSVIIPLYNKEKYIKATLNSVIHQIHSTFEIIIVNDGSTDNSLKVVNSISDYRIQIINQQNKGLSAARNTGIKAAKYDYIAFLDADDLWSEDYLLVISKLIKNEEEAGVYSTKSAILKPKQKFDLSQTTYSSKKTTLISNYFQFKKNLFSNSSVVINHQVFDNIGYYDESINYGEEEDFFIRCFSKYKLVHYNENKVYYLKGIEDQLTSPNTKIDRVIPNYTKYLTNENYKTLKPYIDFIYFKLVVLYKMERNRKLVKKFKAKIEISNLSFIQKIKFTIPTILFYYSKHIYLWFLKIFSHS